MSTWTDRRLIDLLGVAAPVLQAPMAGATTPAMAIGAARGGGLGALACAQYTPDQARAAITEFRAAVDAPLNLNFFAHAAPAVDPARMLAWRARLAPYYVEAGVDPAPPPPAGGRAPFDEAFCALVEDLRPEVVSFHFGLPQADLLDRVRLTGAKILSSATTVAEAVWLEAHGVDAVIAMGAEAGGHRATFLPGYGEAIDNLLDTASQPGLFSLLPQVVAAVSVPVIAAGGIAEARGVAAARVLGAAGVQVGTAYLFTPEAKIPSAHRAALDEARDDNTMLTDVFTGRPARGVANRLMREVGPIGGQVVPPFPLAGGALTPLRQDGNNGDFTNLWAGQSARLAPRGLDAEALTRMLAGA
ncbi:NAD(P)H-dependent flavin oxidoreductase [Caulobacter endophyticus]|uniref:Nitronate monooxygenase n=1 Tax=Caulobacter endophyticus TaxID=2172652 RepID=A0A2T9K5U8_9CAUL|nr:nitronate monooxygenase family protein [Caulobacter endophyticus]PVM91350.1 2-nitropropane dioxygenase [Caulobacter endophyticus]